MTDTPDWANETTNAIIVKYGDRTGTGYVLLKPLIAQALRDLAAEKDKEIEWLRAENEVLRELSEVHSYD